MSKKGIDEETIASIKEMALNGVTPGDISTALGISVSTVHHHKALMRKELSIEFPDVRGQRPVNKPLPDPSTTTAQQFIVNGTRIMITGQPLVINISPDSVSVDYK